MHPRPATARDVDVVTRCISLAFATDPVWEPALRRADRRTDHHAPYWRRFVAAAVDQGTAFMTDGGEAVAVWVPPGGEELPAAGIEALDAFLDECLDAEAVGAMHALYERFEASRAPLGAHYYLSLLATHPDHRGRGIGQALLADNLAAWDEVGVPASSSRPTRRTTIDTLARAFGRSAVSRRSSIARGSPRCGGTSGARPTDSVLQRDRGTRCLRGRLGASMMAFRGGAP